MHRPHLRRRKDVQGDRLPLRLHSYTFQKGKRRQVDLYGIAKVPVFGTPKDNQKTFFCHSPVPRIRIFYPLLPHQR